MPWPCSDCGKPVDSITEPTHNCKERQERLIAQATQSNADVTPKIRTFETGATRDTSEGKLDYYTFFSPEVLERRAQYMHKHRIQPDGSLRAGDNWKKGIPTSAYMASMFRHFLDVWKEYSGVETKDGLEEALCALMFNAEGMLYEVLKEKLPEERNAEAHQDQ